MKKISAAGIEPATLRLLRPQCLLYSLMLCQLSYAEVFDIGRGYPKGIETVRLSSFTVYDSCTRYLRYSSPRVGRLSTPRGPGHGPARCIVQ